MVEQVTRLYKQITNALGNGFVTESGPSGTGLVYVIDKRGWFGWLWGKQVAYYDAYQSPIVVVCQDKDVAYKLDKAKIACILEAP